MGGAGAASAAGSAGGASSAGGAAEDKGRAGALDFLSDGFDALAALRAPGLQPPDVTAPPLDNLSRCVGLLPAEMPEAQANRGERHRRTAESIATQERMKASRMAADAAAQRRARATTLVERAAAAAVKRSLRQELSGAGREEAPEGPLRVLASAFAGRRRVRVTTRHARGVRGVAVGFVVAFDRHFNMVLRDVDEVYTVLATPRHLAAVGGAADAIGAQEQGTGGRKLRSRQQHRTRHMAQIFLRGDQVVLVAIDDVNAPLRRR